MPSTGACTTSGPAPSTGTAPRVTMHSRGVASAANEQAPSACTVSISAARLRCWSGRSDRSASGAGVPRSRLPRWITPLSVGECSVTSARSAPSGSAPLAHTTDWRASRNRSTSVLGNRLRRRPRPSSHQSASGGSSSTGRRAASSTSRERGSGGAMLAASNSSVDSRSVHVGPG